MEEIFSRGALEENAQSRGGALHWLVEGYGYEITGVDVWAAYHATVKAAHRIGASTATRQRIRELVAGKTTPPSTRM